MDGMQSFEKHNGSKTNKIEPCKLTQRFEDNAYEVVASGTGYLVDSYYNREQENKKFLMMMLTKP